MRTLQVIVFWMSIYLCPNSIFCQKDIEFWFVAPETSKGSINYDRPVVFRFCTYDLPGTIKISQPANPDFPSQTISMPPNSASKFELPPNFEFVENTPPNQVLNKGFLIESSSPITVYYEVIGSPPNNPEIFSLKGRNALGKRFFIPFQNIINNTTSFAPQPYAAFDIVAIEDNTEITIIPTKAIVGGAANTPKVVSLNRGQTFSVQASTINAVDRPVGSEVTADKPIAITIKDDLIDGGSIYGNFCRDLVGTQIVPIEKTGTKYVAQKGFLNGDEFVFVLGIEPNTQIYLMECKKGL
ncbi:MAG: hypothetical protein IPM36_00260 [Lewinellaceae bacterium]|nr:hypothetical protein [Lewinellaceae bacterium]